MIAQVAGRLVAKRADRVMIETAGGVGYEIVVPLGVMEQLPAVGASVNLATELVVRDDGWSLYGFHNDPERRFFQRLIGVSGVGPKIAIALMSALGLERGVRAVRERNIALLASVSGIGKKTAERLALELADKLGEFQDVAATAVPGAGGAERGGGEGGEGGEGAEGGVDAALRALERLGYGTAEADRALRQALAADGGGDAETLVRRALQLLTHG